MVRSAYAIRVAILLVCCGCGALVWAADQPDSSKRALDRLRSLAGDWSGTFQWTGARTDAGKMNVHYYVTGNGSAIVEDLSTGDTPNMTSVYHADGADLRLTHFCGAQNQPRLKANKVDVANGVFAFDFLDATNLRSPDAPHVTGLEMHMISADRLMLTFLFEAGGKQSREQITLARVASAAK